MSVTAPELILISSASIPTDDTSTAGGAASTTSRPTLDQFSANAVAAVVSDGADTRTVTITGRLASGVVDTEVLTLNGTTEVVGAKTWERVLSAVASATSGTRTITVRQGTGGTTRATITPNETTRHIAFQQAASSSSGAKTLYEKHFWKNTDGTTALTVAQVTLTADPAAKIKIGLAASKGDSGSVANRVTAPGGISFVDDGVAISVPTGNLGAGETIGLWVQLALLINDAALKSSFTTSARWPDHLNGGATMTNAPEVEPTTLPTRAQAEAAILACAPRCRGVHRDVIDAADALQFTPELHAALVAINRGGSLPERVTPRDLKNMLLALGAKDLAAELDGKLRTYCGADLGAVIIAGPFDGAEHPYRCRRCRNTGVYQAPLVSDEAPADSVQAQLRALAEGGPAAED
jgi:hypothetical protein